MTTIGTAPSKPAVHHPTVAAQLEHRAADLQLKVADAITAFAGSMNFVYLHIVVFAVWMIVVERSPWPTLTLVVSLEAIFLSTFVMIGQNRGRLSTAQGGPRFRGAGIRAEDQYRPDAADSRAHHRTAPSAAQRVERRRRGRRRPGEFDRCFRAGLSRSQPRFEPRPF